MEYTKNNYHISTDRSLINVELVYEYLCYHSYWAEGISFKVVQRSIENSLCFGLYRDEKQIGFARVISDFATYAYLADVFILPEERGKGLSRWLMQVIVDHPQLQGLRRFVLATKDAHSLYALFGFTAYNNPDRLMCRHDPDIYKKKK